MYCGGMSGKEVDTKISLSRNKFTSILKGIFYRACRLFLKYCVLYSKSDKYIYILVYQQTVFYAKLEEKAITYYDFSGRSINLFEMTDWKNCLKIVFWGQVVFIAYKW